ncbi:MAG: tryptophan synthase alpha subunit, partial [Cyclobacteriaceae bacterium]
VGTALVSLMEAHLDDPQGMQQAVGDLIAEMRQAMDAVS